MSTPLASPDVLLARGAGLALLLAAALGACSPSVETSEASGTTAGSSTASSSASSTTGTSSTGVGGGSTGTGGGGASSTGQGGAGGCLDDADCGDPAAPRCDLATGACVACVGDEDCGPGLVCTMEHACAPGCNATHACEAGFSCCGDTCVDLAHDLQHCGACDFACAPSPQAAVACEAGLCAFAGCAPGFADCNGLLVDGCEQNLLQGDACACVPGETKPCYAGAPGTLGVGPCHEGAQICAPDGLAWGACVGQTLPISELCDNGLDDDCNGAIDDVADLDGDGWTICNGDCVETHVGAPAPSLINPGAFEILDNGFDDDCDPSTPDQGPAIGCSPGALVSPVSPDDLVKAMDLCQVTVEDPPLPQKKWGVISATFLLASGSAPSAAQLGAMQGLQTAVLSKFGDVIVPKQGATMAGLSTGKMRDAQGEGFVPASPGSDLGSVSALPPSYLIPHGGQLPSSNGCNGVCPGGVGAFDSVRLHLSIRVPTNAISFSYDFRYFSGEYGSHSCSPYNDAFLVLLGTKAPGIPADENIAFDAVGNPLFANTTFFDACISQGCNICPFGAADLAGTGMELHGATQWLTSDAPVIHGETIRLDFLLFDVTDGTGDTHVLLDRFRWNAPCLNCWGNPL